MTMQLTIPAYKGVPPFTNPYAASAANAIINMIVITLLEVTCLPDAGKQCTPSLGNLSIFA